MPSTDPLSPYCPGPTSRREFLQVGALTLGGLSLSEVLAARALAGESHKDTSVILLYCFGGPSHLETYDLKPDAPSSYRSVFNPISTNVPGIDICEHLPLHAQMADKFSIVRSLNHDIGIHNDGGIVVLTGKRPSKPDPTSRGVSEHPDFGSVTSKLRGMGRTGVPPYVALPRAPIMTQPAYLGMHHSPFLLGDPAQPGYAPPHLKLSPGLAGHGLDDRRGLLRDLDRIRRDLDLNGNLQGTDEFRDLAFQMLTSPQAATAFDINKEESKLRDRYGRNQWGQGCLLARRMAESGVSVVSLWVNTPKVGQEFTNWDDHIQNAGRLGHFAKFMKLRLEYYDQAVTALIEDIHQRNLDKRILVVAMGEFGRTPRLSVNRFGTGRNHWPKAYSALVSGGGLRMGQVVGATNSKGEFPIERPYSPQDMLATIYRHLGINPRRTLRDLTGRPVHILGEGSPIRELI